MKDLTGDECVIKTVTSEGTGWETAKDIDGAVVSYALRAVGAAADAPPLVAAERVELGRCKDAPCPGLTRVLVSMKAGESARVQMKNAPHGGPEPLHAGTTPRRPSPRWRRSRSSHRSHGASSGGRGLLDVWIGI